MWNALPASRATGFHRGFHAFGPVLPVVRPAPLLGGCPPCASFTTTLEGNSDARRGSESAPGHTRPARTQGAGLRRPSWLCGCSLGPRRDGWRAGDRGWRAVRRAAPHRAAWLGRNRVGAVGVEPSREVLHADRAGP